MLMQEVDTWKCQTDLFGCELDEEHFYMFFKDTKGAYDAFQTAAYLALQIYNLQVCLEGILEDMDYLNGQKDKKIKKENRRGNGCAC